MLKMFSHRCEVCVVENTTSTKWSNYNIQVRTNSIVLVDFIKLSKTKITFKEKLLRIYTQKLATLNGIIVNIQVTVILVRTHDRIT